ncbi:MAG: hypothetical protein ACRD3N_02235 [Terracidiphilus sp.]
MKMFKNFAPVYSILVLMAIPAFGQTTVSSPTNGEQVNSPFTLNMSASQCSGLPVSAVGYSLNSSTSTSAWNAQYIDGPVAAPLGENILHVKVWNDEGGICDTDISIDVVAGSSNGAISVSSPTNGQTVNSPFTLNMTAKECDGLPVSAVGYSLNSSTSTSAWNAQYIDGPVAAPPGQNVLHVKAWNGEGQGCDTDVSIKVAASSSAAAATSSGATSVIPSSAVSVHAIQTLGDWTAIHDGATPGSSSGTMSMHSSPSLSGSARLFANQFNDFGGERYAAQFDDNRTAENFFYDAWVYIANNANGLSNLEFDLDQTMSNGETVIMGFQCDSGSGTWDYAVNGGSPTSPNDTWLHSYSGCNVHSWGTNQWHHVQIYFSHYTNGWVTYHSVWLDGTEEDLNFTVFSGYDLGWGPAELTNFQIDGNSSGTTWGNVYLDQLTVYQW